MEVDLLLALRSSKSTYTDAANNIVDVAHSSMPVLVGEWIILMELLNCNFVSSEGREEETTSTFIFVYHF